MAVRQPAVAGTFYPGTQAPLLHLVDNLLEAATLDAPLPAPPKALVVPHAGYAYSGPIAARAYAAVRPWAAQFRRVVLLGPTHRVAVRGLALSGADRFATPLGEVAIDRELAKRLCALPQVQVNDLAHEREHSLEVQLPFLQRVLGSFSLLPLAVGDATPAEVGAVLGMAWGGAETLIVISSDLSHYHPYQQANAIDQATARQLLDLAPAELSHAQACGATPLNGFVRIAHARRLHPKLLDLRNSGDTAGDRDRVVGYAAMAWWEDPVPAAACAEGGLDRNATLGQVLLRHARNAISEALAVTGPAVGDHPALHDAAATFVTLTRGGQLRGCIGTLESCRPLVEDVRENAVAAAFRDPRFPPLQRDELDAVRIEVSLLSPPEAVPFTTESEALAALVPGQDGVILEDGRRRATFLPQVWETLPHPVEFLARLKEKAGLAANAWPPAIRLYRYRVRKWAEA